MGKIIDIQAAATLLAVDYKTIYRLIQSGALPAAKIGRVYRLALEDVERFFQDRKAATMRELRANGQSGSATGAARGGTGPDERQCAWCGRALVLNYSVAAECEEDGCRAIICRDCARTEKVARCPEHALPRDRDERVETLRAQGRVVVSGEELSTLAAAYLSGVAERFDGLSGWPVEDGAVVPRKELAVTIQGNPAPAEWLALDEGQPALFAATIAQRGRIRTGRLYLRLALAAAVHRIAYSHHGFDVQPCTAGDLRALLEAAPRADALVFAVWSPTGWTEQATRQAATGVHGGGRVVLVDGPAGRCIGAQGEEEYLLSPRPDEPAIGECADFIRNALVLHSSLRLETLVEEGGFHREIGARCFERLAADGDYVLDRFEDLGPVISRR
jgi:excisionase family DNA binding protein